VPERPERSSQRRRCFAFAITGIDNDTSFYCHNLTLEKVLDNEPLNAPRPMLPDTLYMPCAGRQLRAIRVPYCSR
jgi:hypothetical protein